MSGLLESVLEAHGGLARWNEFTTLTARIVIGGPFWEFKGVPNFLGDERVEAETHTQKITFTNAEGRVIAYDNRTRHVTVTAADGTIIAERQDPRNSAFGQSMSIEMNGKWDIAHAAYFISYATWHYLTEPFLFTYPGVETVEVDSRVEEDGTVLRGLSVTFPDSIAAHNTRELYYFDDAGLQRRMDYNPEVNGFSPAVHYTLAEQEFQGIVVATDRDVHGRNADRTADPLTTITLDVSDVTFS